jgi:EmrB/QacA subfamily drug resistance transporter
MTQLDTRPATRRAAPVGGPPATAPPLDPRRWRVLAVLSLVYFVVVIDNTIVNVALPSIQQDLSFSISGLAWVLNGYMLTAGGLLLLGGRVADLLGRRRMFLAGTALFALASFACGAAQSPAMLVASRFAQGMGEALAVPAALALIAVLFPSGDERAKALGIWGGLGGLGAIVGVVLSGVLTELVSWRWVFFINLPFAAAALLLVPRLVRESRAQRGGRRVDVVGGILITGGLTSVVYGVLAASLRPWGDAAVVGPLLAGLACLVAFVGVEARSADPLVPLRFFLNRLRVTANLSSLAMIGGMSAVFLLVTLYMQEVLGYSPLRAGLAYVPFCILFVLVIVLSTQLVPPARVRWTLSAAFAFSAAGLLLLSRIPVHGSYLGSVLPGLAVLAVGLGLGFPALQNAALHQVSERDAGLGSGVQTTVQALGGAIGNAVFLTVALRHAGARVAAGTPPAAAAVAGFQLAFRLGALVLAVGAVAVLVVMRRPPAGPVPEPAPVQEPAPVPVPAPVA